MTEIEQECPFCGGTDIKMVENGPTDEWCSMCRECEACGPISDSKMSATRIWNERA